MNGRAAQATPISYTRLGAEGTSSSVLVLVEDTKPELSPCNALGLIIEDEETVVATQHPRFFFSLLGDYRAIHMFQLYSMSGFDSRTILNTSYSPGLSRFA